MTKKEIIGAVFAGQKDVPQVPIWELEFHGWNRFSKQKLKIGTEFDKLTASEQEKALHTNADIICEVSEKLSFHAVTTPGSYWEVAPNVPAFFWLRGENRFRQIEILKKTAGNRFMLIGNCGGTIGIPHSDKYLEFSYLMYDKPEKIDAMAQTSLKYGTTMAKRLADLGVGAMFTSSDIADNHGVFFPPELFSRFVLPYLKEMAETVRGLGCFFIQHTDGNIMSVMEALVESGIHALQAIDPVAGMDIREVKRRFQTITLCGNVDCGNLVMGTPESVFEETHRLLVDCKINGRLVLGASNAVQEDVPSENYMAMIEAWKEYGQY